MTKDEALKLAKVCIQASLEYKRGNATAVEAVEDIDAMLAQPVQKPVAWEQFHEHLVERNFCPRCGKRTADLTTIHTCTPPHDKT